MKRYKVVEPIKVEHPDAKGFEAIIPAGTEICLEEVMDTKVKILGHFCSYSKDCPNCKKEREEVKEEKEHRHCWEKMEQLNADHGDCEFCCECKRPYQPCGVKRATDQPLTPKDVGLSVDEALSLFHEWLDDKDRLYQEFLKSCKK